MIAAGNSLRQLAQFRLVEQRAQFLLPDQDDLQQLGRRRLEVGEQSHLLERLRAEVLRLVDDQHDAPCASVRLEQVVPQQIHEGLGTALAGFRHGHMQFFADRQQELGGRDARIEDQGDFGIARQLLEQAADDRGLAGADFTRQLDEPSRLVDTVQKMRQRLGVPLTEVQVAGVRRDRERFFLEPEKACVHAD